MAADPHYVFLLKYNHYGLPEKVETYVDGAGKVSKRTVDDLTDTLQKMDTDAQHWGGDEKATFLPVTGEYDVVVLAKGGDEKEALHYAVYLHRTDRYQVVATLTGHTIDDLSEVIMRDPDPKKR